MNMCHTVRETILVIGLRAQRGLSGLFRLSVPRVLVSHASLANEMRREKRVRIASFRFELTVVGINRVGRR